MIQFIYYYIGEFLIQKGTICEYMLISVKEEVINKSRIGSR